MNSRAEKKILVISSRKSFDEAFRRVFVAGCKQRAPADAAEATHEPAKTRQGLRVDTVAPSPRLPDTVRIALKMNRPYRLAVLDWEGLDGQDGFELLDALWQIAPQMAAVVACSDPDGTRQEAFGRWQVADRYFIVPETCDPPLWRQVVAVQLDRHLLREELRQTTAELEQARASAAQARQCGKQAEQFKNEFLANMSHEIRTPMNAILGFSRLLMKEPLKPRQAEKLRYVLEAANTLSDIIGNVLDFAKLAGGQFRLQNTRFDPRAVIHGVLQSTCSAAREKGLSVSCHVQQAIPSRLQGDGTRFRQILVNLVNNAVKFTAQGSIHIQSTIDEETEKMVYLRTVVTDTGGGIPADRQAIVFKEFAQADGSTTRQFGGLGLGLTICKQLVDRMDGQIGFRSGDGQGSSFWFTVPLAKTPEPAPLPAAESGTGAKKMPSVPPRAATAGGDSRLCLLVADDDPLTRTLLEALLTRAGCLVDLATNGTEALELAEAGRYDLVITDVWMPETDGFEVIRQIRRREASTGRHVPILALTAENSDDDRQCCLAAGADEYLAKPFTPEALFETVGRHCRDFLEAIDPEQFGDHAQPVETELALAGCFAALRQALADQDLARVERHGRDLQHHAKTQGEKAVADTAMRVVLAARSRDVERVAAVLEKFDATRQHSPTP